MTMINLPNVSMSDTVAAPPTTILTHEQREAAYEQLGKLAVVGQDEAVELIKRLLTSIDRAESRVRDFQATELARKRRQDEAPTNYDMVWTTTSTSFSDLNAKSP